MAEMLHIVSWRWGTKYPPTYVDRLAAGVRRNCGLEYRFILVTDDPNADYSDEVDVTTAIIDPHLTRQKGCFARLRLFDPLWQAQIGIVAGDRIVNMDLDSVAVGQLDPLFTREEPFSILQHVNNQTHPCPFNGSLWSLRAGYRADVWRGFSMEAAARLPKAEFPDDQAWFYEMMPTAGAFTVHDGVFAFQKPGWPPGIHLPQFARLICFPGARDPNHFIHLPWVRRHWVGDIPALERDGAKNAQA